jgi:hypothetical protein
MERFKVSGQDLRDFYNQTTHLSKVFKDIEQDLRSTNQVVCRYILNGMELEERDELKFAGVTLDQVESLEYLTENARDLASLVISGWIQALPELIKNTEGLSLRVRAQGFNGLLKPIHDLVKNCEFLVESIITLKEMLGDQFLGAAPIDWAIAEQSSKKAVLEALEALTKKDFVQLAEVLEYDLSHALQLWMDTLKVLEKSIHGEYTGTHFNPKSTGSNPVGGKRLAN